MHGVVFRARRLGRVLFLASLLVGPASQFRAAAQDTNPAVAGQWSSVLSWPDVAIHAQLLPTGKVMFNTREFADYAWDPVTGGLTTLATNAYAEFCSGHTLLGDGRILFAGGPIGAPYASIYDPFTNTWLRLPDLNASRWYPSCVTLPDGSALALSGSMNDQMSLNDLPQVWQNNGTWRNLTNARLTVPLYPNLFLAPNGKVFLAGPATITRYLDTSGDGAWSPVANRSVTRDYGPGVLYDNGKVLLVGGGDPPVASAEVIDLNAASPAWRSIASMSVPRRQANATLLPDGKVLITGGTSGGGFNNTATPVYTAEMWDPVTEKFTLMAKEARPRWYHSTAVLLPDARVLSAGGDDNPTAQIYSPPYLFKGARPTISSVPGSVAYGQSFSVGTPQAANIGQVTWLRLSSVTHTVNMNQRINRLAFSQGSGGLNVTAPGNANLAPPGHYMLFLVDKNGVPSVARILQIGGPSGAPPSPPSQLVIAAVSGTQVNLSWSDNSANEAGFVIEISANGTTFTPIASVGPNVTSYSVVGLLPSTTYSYHVYAYNNAGNSGYSETVQVATLANNSPTPPPAPATPTTPPTSAAPAAPSNLTAVAVSSSQVNLAWTDNSSDEGGFAIDRAKDGQPWMAIATVGPNVTSYASTNLEARTTYWFRVRASKGTLYSDFSPAVVVGTGSGPSSPQPTPASPPAAPSNLAAAPISSSQINLAWSDNGGQKDGFAIERSTNGTSFSQIANVGPSVTSYADLDLAPSTPYYYRVAAFNSGGKSAFSNMAQATTASVVPTGAPTPTNLSATLISATQVQLLWTDPGGFKDGYKIERSLDGVSFTPIATIGATATTFLDDGVVPAVKYFYRVRSYAGPSNSAYSNTATVTTAGTGGTVPPPSSSRYR